MDKIQAVAISVLGQVLGGRNLNQVLSEELAASRNLTPQQRGAVQDISYGTLRHLGQLNHILQALLQKPLKDQRIRQLLLLALYQLQYTRAAPHAVVDHAVKTARKLNAATSGLVNAILRNFLRQQQTLVEQVAQTDEGRYSYPVWWIARLRKQYADKANGILLAGNQHPPMTLRVNRKKIATEQYLQMLQKQEVQAKLIEPDAVLLQEAMAVEKLPGFTEGLFSVQDAGAQYAALLLDVEDGMRVLDACAAPGGKTTHLLEMADVELQALDKDEQRLQRVRENVHRLGLQADILQGDAAEPQAWWDGKRYQRILADVPCSASGVVKRHPDIKWLRRDEDIAGFARQQRQILEALWQLLEEGGKLLYATCSVFQQENREVVEAFLSRTDNALQLPVDRSDMIDGQLLPNDQHDGFFYALIQKLPAS